MLKHIGSSVRQLVNDLDVEASEGAIPRVADQLLATSHDPCYFCGAPAVVWIEWPDGQVFATSCGAHHLELTLGLKRMYRAKEAFRA